MATSANMTQVTTMPQEDPSWKRSLSELYTLNPANQITDKARTSLGAICKGGKYGFIFIPVSTASIRGKRRFFHNNKHRTGLGE